ncbi:MAG: hypothetical protein U1E02_08435, partial [Hydrogenophaga sp.]|nr:hypothetical protein [Hydrogenophaga sp.]
MELKPYESSIIMGLVTANNSTPATAAPTPAIFPAKTSAKAGAKRPTKPKRSALDILRLQIPSHALLCPPSDYVDCRNPIEHITRDMVGCEPTLISLTFTGSMHGVGPNRNVVWTIPSEKVPHLGALTWPMIKSTQRTDVELQDVAGNIITASLFFSPKNWIDYKPGDTIRVLGRIKQFGRNLSLEIIKEVPSRAIDSIWSQYAGIQGQIAGERIEILVNSCVDNEDAYLACTAVILGETGLNEEKLMEACGTTPERGFQSCHQMLRALHRPNTVEEGKLALEYAKRITALGIQASALRHHLRHPHPKAPIPVSKNSVIKVMSALGFALTKGQQDVALQVTERLSQPKPLNALLSGDVGTGKTLAFLAPAVAAHLAGARVAIITPRTLLADQ